MRLGSIPTILAITILVSLPSFAARARRGPTAPHSHAKASRSRATKASAARPRAIDDARAAQIQSALVKAGYLTGEPSGHWDATSQAAMEKLQSDNGWQTKLVPDSRALIKLGLGTPTESAETRQPLTQQAATIGPVAQNTQTSR